MYKRPRPMAVPLVGARPAAPVGGSTLKVTQAITPNPHSSSLLPSQTGISPPMEKLQSDEQLANLRAALSAAERRIKEKDLETATLHQALSDEREEKREMEAANKALSARVEALEEENASLLQKLEQQSANAEPPSSSSSAKEEIIYKIGSVVEISSRVNSPHGHSAKVKEYCEERREYFVKYILGGGGEGTWIPAEDIVGVGLTTSGGRRTRSQRRN